jgi:drug/metabolite transporter (DMT)-like permease
MHLRVLRGTLEAMKLKKWQFELKVTRKNIPPANEQEEQSNTGIYWMLLTMFLFVTGDTIAKYLIQDYEVIQIVWGRYFFHALILTSMFGYRLKKLLITQNLKLQLGRSLLLLATTSCFFMGLNYVELADASAIMIMGPIFVTALSVPLLREYVGPRRWISVLIGCIGGLIIIRPGNGILQPESIFPMMSAVLFAFYQISTRFLNHSDSVFTTLFYSASIGALLSSIITPFYWQPMKLGHWGLLVLLGLVAGLGHFTLIKAYRASTAATVVPFTYTNLLWATAYGYLIFDDLPDQWTIIGASIIIVCGLYIFQREQKLKNKNRD